VWNAELPWSGHSAIRIPRSALDFSLMPDPKPPRRTHQPLLDALGTLCTEGKQSADYLWQVPDDAAVREKILTTLDQIATESRKQGRREMPKIAEDLKVIAQKTPSPQQVDLLVNGFDRLIQLWQAAKSGLL